MMGTGSLADPAEGQRTNPHSREGRAGRTQGHYAALLSLEVLIDSAKNRRLLLPKSSKYFFPVLKESPRDRKGMGRSWAGYGWCAPG